MSTPRTYLHKFDDTGFITVTEEEHRRIHASGFTKKENEEYKKEIMQKYRLRVWEEIGLSWQNQPVKVEFT